MMSNGGTAPFCELWKGSNHGFRKCLQQLSTGATCCLAAWAVVAQKRRKDSPLRIRQWDSRSYASLMKSPKPTRLECPYTCNDRRQSEFWARILSRRATGPPVAGDWWVSWTAWGGFHEVGNTSSSAQPPPLLARSVRANSRRRRTGCKPSKSKTKRHGHCTTRHRWQEPRSKKPRDMIQTTPTACALWLKVSEGTCFSFRIESTGKRYLERRGESGIALVDTGHPGARSLAMQLWESRTDSSQLPVVIRM